jgi:transposase
MARLQRDLNREQVWRRHLDRQQSRGLTVRAYCRANTLRETAFFYWKKEIAKRDRAATPSATPSAPAFVPVAVIGPPADRNESPIDIRLVEGPRLRVRSGCDLDLLADVLAMLRRSAAEGRPC